MIVFVVSENAFILLFPKHILHSKGQKRFLKVNRAKFEGKSVDLLKKNISYKFFPPPFNVVNHRSQNSTSLFKLRYTIAPL